MKRIIIIFIMSISLFSCHRHHYTQQETLKGWQGKNINVISDILGYPENQIKAPNGNLVYIYYSNRRVKNIKKPLLRSVGNLEYNKLLEGPDYYELSCTCFIEVDANNIIRNIKYKGDDCDSMREKLWEKEK